LDDTALFLTLTSFGCVMDQDVRRVIAGAHPNSPPSHMLINGKPAYSNFSGGNHEIIEVEPGTLI